MSFHSIDDFQPALVIRAGFLIASCCIIAIQAIPALRSRFLAYGLRSTFNQPEERHEKRLHDETHKDKITFNRSGDGLQNRKRNDAGHLQQTDIALSKTELSYSTATSAFLDKVATYRVPHSWFNHFYIASVASSLFWAYQVFLNGALLHRAILTSRFSHTSFHPSMSASQLQLVWTLMLFQGIRRLIETIKFAKPSSKSTMWIGHYALGMGFYIFITPALCVEALPVVENAPEVAVGFGSVTLTRAVGMLVFAISSYAQYIAHAHLASLTVYTLPPHPLFKYMVAPHYTAETLIYASLALIAAPEGRLLNVTVVTAFVFVAVNLGVTAQKTREWYAARVGEEQVRRKWVLLPGIW